jgi:hypothetical protein
MFEVQRDAASTLFTGPGNRRLRFVGVLKQKPQGIEINKDEELKSEILTIFPGIPSDELKKSFDHRIERCQWAAANAGNYHLS